MKTLTLSIDDSVSDKFMWLLQHFSSDEIRIVSSQAHLSDDEYLRSIDGMVQSGVSTHLLTRTVIFL